MDKTILKNKKCSSEANADVSQITSEHLCLSCGACSTACGQHAISFHETIGGYLFPNIDSNACVKCGLCYEVCPGIHFGKSLMDNMPQNPFVGDILSCHVGKAINQAVFKNSQSGGVLTAMLVQLMASDRIAGAILAEMSGTPPRGKAFLAKTVDDFLHSQKSKYTPIPMLRQIMEVEGPVAFVGLPCHIHGLNNLLDHYPELKSKIFVKIGLICDRVLTSAAVDFLILKAGCTSAKDFIFRDKNRPTYPGNVFVESENGKQVVLDASLRMAIKDYFTPARCTLCFDKLNVYADVVVGDPHGIDGVDRYRGESLLIERTQKGKHLVSDTMATGTVALRQVNENVVIEGQGINKKKQDWLRYVKAWSSMGRKLPSYCQSVMNGLETLDVNFEKHKDSLMHSVGLDAFDSRKAVLVSINKLLPREGMKEKIIKVLRRAKNLTKRVITKVRHIF